MTRRVRWAVRQGKTVKLACSGRTVTVRGFGVRVGYWPCLEAPFVEVSFNKKRYSVWYGQPGYEA